MRSILGLSLVLLLLAGCSGSNSKTEEKTARESAKPAYFTINPATAGVITGTITFSGRKPHLKPIDMSSDPACVEAHHGKAYD